MVVSSLILALAVSGGDGAPLQLMKIVVAFDGPATPPQSTTGKKNKPAPKTGGGGSGGYQSPGDQVPPNDGQSGPTRPTIATPSTLERPSVPGPDGTPAPIPGRPELPRVGTEKDNFESFNDRFDIWWERNRFALVHFPELHYGTSVQGRTDATATPAEVNALRSEAIDLMRPLLSHPQGRIRAAAALGLGKLKAQSAFEELKGLLEDPESNVRDAACLALGLIDDPRADHLLLHYVTGTSSAGNARPDALAYRRGFAAIALALGHSKSTPRLLMSLAKSEDLDPEVRAFVVSALSACGDAGQLPDLAALVDAQGLHNWVQQALYAGFAKMAGASAVPLLVRGVRSNAMSVARSSAMGLGLSEIHGDTTLTDALEQVTVATEDVGLRNFATISLGRIGGTNAERTLSRFLMRGRQQQVPWAAMGLGLLSRSDPSPATVDLLLQKLKSANNVDHRSAICLALGLSGSRQAEPALIAELDSAQPKVAGFAAAALGMIRSSQGSAALAARAGAVPGAGHLVPPAVIDEITFALSLIDDEPALRALFELFENESRPEVRLAAARAIGHMGRIESFNRIKHTMQSSQTDPARLSESVAAMGTLLAVDRTPRLSRVMANSNFADEPPTFRALAPYLW